MKRRLAVKAGYYRASQYIYANKDSEANQDWLDQLRLPPEHYTAELCAYFHEGFALGLDISDSMKHPFGELKCNGGSPMLPVMGWEVPDQIDAATSAAVSL